MSSHAYVLYLVSVKPYQTPLMNNFVLANETFYSAQIIAIFIFSDATPELYIKFAAGVVLISSTFLLLSKMDAMASLQSNNFKGLSLTLHPRQVHK